MNNWNSYGQTETRKVSLSRNVDFKIMNRMTMNVMASAGKIFLSFRFWSYYRNIERFEIISSLKFGKFLNFRIANHVEPELGNTDGTNKVFWSIWKVCRRMSTHSNAYANAKKCIFDSHFPGNWFEFGIIENDFWSSTIWAIYQIQVDSGRFKIHSLGSKILKFPEFNLNIDHIPRIFR